MSIHRLLALAVMAVVATAGSPAAAQVSINGEPVPRAVSTIDGTQEVTEFREGGSQIIQLVPGAKRYGVCIQAQGPIALLDAELPLGDSPSRFIVKVEDGRELAQCLLASLTTDAASKRRFTYCLRCENVTLPEP